MGQAKCKRGSISGKPPEGVSWIWITQEMMASPLWLALSISARRIIETLMIENMSHAGCENGNLAATYAQLKARGVTERDIRPGFDELLACGFLRRTFHAPRVAGGGDPSRYALTWLPTHRKKPNAAVATDDWRGVLTKLTRANIREVRDVKRWLRQQVERSARRSASAAGSQDIDSTPQMRGGDHLQMRGEDLGNIVTLTPQMRGVAVRK